MSKYTKEMDINEILHKLMSMRSELKSMTDVIESIITNLAIKEQGRPKGDNK